MSKSRTSMVLSILGLLSGGIMIDAAMADNRGLVDTVRLVANQKIGEEKVWEQEISITEAGNYKLLVDEASGSAETSQLSAVLIAGDRNYIRAENGTLSAGVELPVGTYKLFVTYKLPSTSPWVTLQSSLSRNGSMHSSATKTFVNDALGENERVLRFDLNKKELLPGNGTEALLSVVEVSEPKAASLLTQVIDSAGIVKSQSGETEVNTGKFTFDENAQLFLYVRFADGAEEVELNVQVAGHPVGLDDLITIERDQTSVDLSQSDTDKLTIAVERGTPVTVSFRGVDLGPEPDDLGVLITTMSIANTFKFTEESLSTGPFTRTFIADSDRLYIARYANAGDLAIVATVKNQFGAVIYDQLLVGDRLIKLGEFTQAAPAQYSIALKDFQFPHAFNALSIAAIPSDASLAAESIEVTSSAKSVDRLINLFAGKYHVVAVANIGNTQSGTYAFSVANGGDIAFKAMDTLGDNIIPAEPFTLSSNSNVKVKLFDHQYPAKLDSLSVGILDNNGIVASGNSIVEQQLQNGNYYLAVAAKSAHSGVYHLSASATDVGGATPTPGGNEPPRNTSGKGGKGGGGGSLGAEWLLAMLGFGVFRHRFKHSSRNAT